MKIINITAASAFGVLLVHNGSDTMRWWLWVEHLQNVKYLYAGNAAANAFITCIVIYALCTGIDLIRYNLIERPLFGALKKRRRK